MIAFYKRELQGYFRGLFGWIFVAALILSAGAITAVVNLIGGSSQFSYLFATLPEVLILLFPLLASRTFTREHSMQNSLWLNSLPVTEISRVAGKYLAMLTLFAIPTAALTALPPLLALFGPVAYGSAYVSLLGYFLMGAALLAVCGLTASLFRKQIFAVVWNILLCLLLYFLPLLATVCSVFPVVGCLCCILPFLAGGIRQAVRCRQVLKGVLLAIVPAAVLGALCAFLPHIFSRFLPAAMEFCSPFVRLDGFRAGHFDLPAAGYLISVAVLFPFLTACLPLRFRKIKSQTAANRSADDMKKSGLPKTAVRLSVLTAILFLLNLALSNLPFQTAHPDVSGKTTYALSDTTRRYLSSLDQSLAPGKTAEIIYHCGNGIFDADEDIYPFLLQYASASPRISVRLQHADGISSVQQIEIRSTDRSRTLTLSDLCYYYSAGSMEMLSQAEYSKIMQVLSALADSADAGEQQTYQVFSQLYDSAYMMPYFTGDANLTAAIRYVLADEVPMICEYSVSGSGGIHLLFRQRLEQAGYEVQTLTSLADIPAECRAICADVSSDLSDTDIAALNTWMANGGKLFLTTTAGSTNLPNLGSVLNAYGLSVPDGAGYVSDGGYPYFAATAGTHTINQKNGSSCVAVYQHPIQVSETEGVSHSTLLQSSGAASYTVKTGDGQSQTVTGQAPLCVLAEKETPEGNSSVIWLSMRLDALASGFSGGANLDFAVQCLSWLTGAPVASASAPNGIAFPSDRLSVGTGALVFWILAFVLLIPAVLIAVGSIRVYVRKRK